MRARYPQHVGRRPDHPGARHRQRGDLRGLAGRAAQRLCQESRPRRRLSVYLAAPGALGDRGEARQPDQIARRAQGQDGRHPQPGRHRLYRCQGNAPGDRHGPGEGRRVGPGRRRRAGGGRGLSRPRRRHGVLGRQLRPHRDRRLPAAPAAQLAGHAKTVRQRLSGAPHGARQGPRSLCPLLPRHGEVDGVRLCEHRPLHPAALGGLSRVQAQGKIRSGGDDGSAKNRRTPARTSGSPVPGRPTSGSAPRPARNGRPRSSSPGSRVRSRTSESSLPTTSSTRSTPSTAPPSRPGRGR